MWVAIHNQGAMSDANRRQVKRIVITPQMILDLFDPRTRCVNGLPDDTEVVKIWEDHARDTFEIMIKSETFAPVEQGEEAPEYDLVMENVERFGTKSGLH
jgi:hypothetical protein